MIKNKVFAIITAGCLTASLGVSALAYTKNGTAAKKSNPTQATVPFQGHGQGERHGRDGDHQGNLKTELTALVKAGTISQAIADKITAYQTAQQTTRQAEMDKLKNMTATERSAYQSSLKQAAKTDLYTDLVSKGVLTQTEADKIKAAIESSKQAEMKTALDALVTSNTLTQAAETAIITALNQADAARIAEKAKLDAMSETDRQAYLQSQKSDVRTNPLSALVTSGTLTKAQADAASKVLPGHNGFGGGNSHHGFDHQ